MKRRKIIIKSEYALVPLTQNKFAIIDLEDIERIEKYDWHTAGNKKRPRACRTYHFNGKSVKFCMARFIMNLKDKELQVDHINHNTLDNRKDNLRICTRAENSRNRKKPCNSSHKYKGIRKSENNKKYIAKIKIDNKQKYLGTFDSELDAAKAYDKAAKKYFGEFAWLNFPNKLINDNSDLVEHLSEEK